MTSLFPSIIKFLCSVALLPVHTLDVHLILFHLQPKKKKKKSGDSKKFWSGEIAQARQSITANMET